MTLIIGKSSNLSTQLMKNLSDVAVVSVREFLANDAIFNDYRSQTLKVIFNNFQTAVSLNDLGHPATYVSQSLYATSLILEKLQTFTIEKIIYTSSSSVYGNNKLCAEDDVPMPLHLHAALKLSNEYLISKFCLDHEIDYTIVRLFNMYGGNDQFSVISKIIKAYQEDNTLNVINDGESIRDYIYIKDVVKIYERILDLKNIPILNIGSGQKRSIKEILEFLKSNGKSIKTENSTRDEIKISIADNRLLLRIMDDMKLKKVEEYILEVLNQ